MPLCVCVCGGGVTPRDVLLVGWPRNAEVKAGREAQTNYFVASRDNKKNAAAARHRVHAHVQPLPLRRTGERTANEALQPSGLQRSCQT